MSTRKLGNMALVQTDVTATQGLMCTPSYAMADGKHGKNTESAQFLFFSTRKRKLFIGSDNVKEEINLPIGDQQKISEIPMQQAAVDIESSTDVWYDQVNL